MGELNTLYVGNLNYKASKEELNPEKETRIWLKKSLFGFVLFL